MNARLRRAYRLEMLAARNALDRNDLAVAFPHLERAHILGQRHTWPHVASHVWMLRVGWRRRDRREVVGQLFRVVAAACMSRIWVPLGNTGGASVSAMRVMPVPADLQHLLGSPPPAPHRPSPG